MSKQPEALRLADALERNRILPAGDNGNPLKDAAANELRCLHAVNSELLEALKAALSLIEIVIPFDGDVTRMVRKAIAKATGEQP